MKKLIFSFVTVFVMSAWSMPSSALFLSQGESALYNYELLPGPTFTEVHIVTSFSGFDTGESLDRELYSELDAMGTLLINPPVLDGPETSLSITYGSPDVTDGVFSVLFTAVLGSFEITDTYAYGCDDLICHPSVSGELVNGVPEPSTLVLLGFGLVGVTLARRRKGQVHAV